MWDLLLALTQVQRSLAVVAVLYLNGQVRIHIPQNRTTTIQSRREGSGQEMANGERQTATATAATTTTTRTQQLIY